MRWTYIEPMAPSSIRSLLLPVVMSVALAACFVGFLAFGVHDQIDQNRAHRYLQRRGVPGRAVIVDTTTAGSGEDAKYQVTIYVAECGCTVTKSINTLFGHEVGSSIAIRYDPERPRTLELGVDRIGNFSIATAGTLGSLAIVLAVRWSFRAWKHRQSGRRARATGKKRSVVVQLWRRSDGRSTRHYLVAYDADDKSLAHPLLCVRAKSGTRFKIGPLDQPGGTLDLWGDPDRGSAVALRRRNRDVVPARMGRPGTWEADLRALVNPESFGRA